MLSATRWDSEAEAREFFDAYVATLQRRFPRASAVNPTARLYGTSRPNGAAISVVRRGADVDIVDGAEGKDLPALHTFLESASRK